MRPFRDEKGFTTTSMVLSMLITLALVFTAAQVYRVNSVAAEVQDVADAAALAAENQVAEFMIVARFCDAVVLSLSLAGLTACGLGIAALCTPATAELSEKLIEAGKNLIDARDKFSDRSKRALDKLQRALPFFAAACAAGVSAANNGDSAGSNYIGVGLLVPSKGEPIVADVSGAADELLGEIDSKADDIREKAREAEEASQKANAAKMEAFLRDCGDNPAYCMYERAATLIGMSGSRNPLYSSVDAWSFSVALARAQNYYVDRYEKDEATGGTPEDIARWHLRLDFYKYADDLLHREGYVHETGDSFQANFPHLPSNTDEMRQTSLYTSAVYPITEEPVSGVAPDGAAGGEAAPDDTEVMPVMHAWAGCPGATGPVTVYNSIAYMESANLPTCPVCGFTAASMGKVAAASTSIDNGFEYHYEAVARAAFDYQVARERADGPKAAVKGEAEGLFGKLVEAFKESIDKRIEVAPPGRFGAISFVVNAGDVPVAGGFANGFATSGGSIGPRAAISAATLIDEGSDEGRTVLNSALDGLRENGGVAVGAFGIVLDVWSNALSAYSNGIGAVTGGVESGLNSLPLVGASGLGTWAADKLRGALDDVGLQPAKLEALKPVLVNSSHVAAKDDGRLGSGLTAVKQQVLAHPLYSTDLFSALLTDAERTAIEQVSGLGDEIEIASIELLGDGGPSIPITIPLPDKVKQYGIGVLQGLFDRIRAYHAETTEVRAWE
ncbi:MAG: molybdenum cofactor biosynthesis enzyme [Eggerthellaceae bacterium]|nr:molybdenum cofactor biosynthesis enzyme [Eggerthellaceae bacterium]